MAHCVYFRIPQPSATQIVNANNHNSIAQEGGVRPPPSKKKNHLLNSNSEV